MTKLRLFPAFLLLALLMAACASAATSTPLQTQPEAVEPTAAAQQEPTAEQAPAVEETSAPSVEALPAATSRGPDLHATDPATVSLASGGLQLVEFIRFT
ncbi:MAG TPA: hypothetical protein VHO49_15775 [Anaerolineales bacterium]|nr:hypothetical protein [Anaerolineales bacterium]